jgi:hypothetical protein
VVYYVVVVFGAFDVNLCPVHPLTALYHVLHLVKPSSFRSPSHLGNSDPWIKNVRKTLSPQPGVLGARV